MAQTADPRIAQMGREAERLFGQGYCCSEAMVMAAAKVFTGKTDPSHARMAKGLCGGMGDRKATCGVFTGGAVALGLVPLSAADDTTIRELSARFCQCLEEESGGQICEELLEQMGLANVNRRLCKRLTKRGAQLLAQLVIEEGVSSPS